MKFDTIPNLLKSLIAWRLLLILITAASFFLIPLRDGFTTLGNSLPQEGLLSSLANFDGLHYIKLARYGYNHPFTGFLHAFFPVFPLAIRNLEFYFADFQYAGLLISHLSLGVAFYTLYKLLRLDFDSKTTNLTLFLILIFPTAFFFGNVYTESLFLCLSVLAFYFAKTKQWNSSLLMTILATGTRFAGIFLIPALLYEFYLQKGSSLKKTLSDPRVSLFLLAPLGLFLYMQYLKLTTGDPLFFINVQPLFGAQREVGRMILLHQVFYRYGRMMLTVPLLSPLYFTVILEFIVGLTFLALSFLLIKKNLTYALYVLPSYLLPTLTGTFSSLPRYVLVLFPAFAVAALYLQKLPKAFQYLIYVLLSAFQITALMLFTRGYFIS